MNSITSLSSSIPSLAATDGSSTTKKAGADALTSKDTFLKLLVAQLKNQDPTNPTDSTQFVGQLTQYSELEQLIGINGSVQKLAVPPATPTATTDKPTAV